MFTLTEVWTNHLSYFLLTHQNCPLTQFTSTKIRGNTSRQLYHSKASTRTMGASFTLNIYFIFDFEFSKPPDVWNKHLKHWHEYWILLSWLQSAAANKLPSINEPILCQVFWDNSFVVTSFWSNPRHIMPYCILNVHVVLYFWKSRRSSSELGYV